ncbi:Ig-like domain-containing protein [Paramaledivibacter caminithermalis]|jgi:hypothetical protein|uniref:SbsA Ig-like domain-containing protein n=1 Tax=Paramaledivibacter caminithermalis (strain DSM 15212 / CIP 107654 / DViRD3) TaxID=1121301 RepID=A0A1M6R8V3_PARC5|nr:Ig-like domain-containing protein [Paramaledivibacter caminithermalis]SHK28909.1 hypothetical protein SAMN02745912_02881 [Paramaledivibacter caminithermalis DSM 15212]
MKRIFSILLIFAMMFSFMPLINKGFDAYADNSGQEIRVRIEGKTDTLFDEMIAVTDEETGEDLLRTAIGDDQIVGDEGQWGLFINGLLGEMAGESRDGYMTSWGLYVAENGVLKSSPTSISTLQIGGIDELLLHLKASDLATWSDLTFIPRLYTVQEGKITKLIVKKVVTTYDENWNTVESEKIEEGALLTIDGIEYITDENGEVSIELQEGTYEVNVSKEGENYPELIRDTFELIVEYDKFDGDDSDYELWKVENPDVALDKTWTIKFNDDVLESSLNDAIVVVDSEGYIVTCEIQLLEDNKTIKVYAPQGGYDVGENYTLYIKNEIESKDGKVLNKSWKVPFTIIE